MPFFDRRDDDIHINLPLIVSSDRILKKPLDRVGITLGTPNYGRQVF
jgi:hypothetical protein